jgi:putative serine protease PepD
VALPGRVRRLCRLGDNDPVTFPGPTDDPDRPYGAPPPPEPTGRPAAPSPYHSFGAPRGPDQPGVPAPPPGPWQQYPPRRGSSTPGWLWPLVAGLALVVGIVGGMLGGALVLGTSSTGSGVLPEAPGASPLPVHNGSITSVAAKLLPSTVQVRVLNGHGATRSGDTGSGFVVDRQGHVITNNHVVELHQPGGDVDVIDNKGRRHVAHIVGSSPVYDIAVLRIDHPQGLPPAPLGSSNTLRVGDTVVAIGSPLGLSSTVTSGIVSAVDRPVTTGSESASSYIDAVQTDAAINPGNSGGPLVDMRGQVVGVNSAIATTGTTLGGESGNIGVGFAIPMEQVRVTAEQILKTGSAEYPVIGADVSIKHSISGARILGVPSGSPAARAGLRKGDRVVAIEGKRVADGVSLIVAIRAHRPGEVITLTVVRGGHEQNVRVRLDAKTG